MTDGDGNVSIAGMVDPARAAVTGGGGGGGGTTTTVSDVNATTVVNSTVSTS